MLVCSSASGRRVWRRLDALLLPLLLAVSLAACGERRTAAAERHRLPLGADTIDLGPNVTVHDVRLGGGDITGAIRPETVRARVGDVIRFVAADSRGQAVIFEDSMLSRVARQFLRNSRQMSGPPLISTGASWVVSLKGAPPGRYPFRSLTRPAEGVLIVTPAGP